MKNRTISHRQMMTVVFLALFPLGTEVLYPRLASAGAAGWLCPLLAGVGAVGIAALAGKGKVLAGEKENRVLWRLLLLWGLFFGGAQACRLGVRLSDSLGASPALMTGLLPMQYHLIVLIHLIILCKFYNQYLFLHYHILLLLLFL